MLRLIFVLSLLTGLGVVALRGPMEAMVLYLWLAYFRPEAWIYGGLLASLPLSYVAGIYLVLRVGFSATMFRFDLRVLALLLVWATAIVGGLLTPWPDETNYILTAITKAFLVAYFVALLSSTIGRFRGVIAVIALSLGLEQAKQGWVRLILAPGSKNDNPHVLLGDNNAVAAGMMMLVPFFIILARTTKNKYERWFAWFMLVGVLYRGLSTYSRGGFLAALAMALVSILRSPKRVRALVGGAVLAAVISTTLPQEYWDRMATVSGEQSEEGGQREFDGSAASRLYFWRLAVRMANDNFAGVGPGGYKAAYPTYDLAEGAYGTVRAVHSVWFGTLAELGYPGLAALMVNLLLAWLACARAQWLAKSGLIPPEFGAFGAGLESSIVAYMVAGTFLNIQYLELFWHIVGLTIALHWNTTAALEQAPPGREKGHVGFTTRMPSQQAR